MVAPLQSGLGPKPPERICELQASEATRSERKLIPIDAQVDRSKKDNPGWEKAK